MSEPGDIHKAQVAAFAAREDQNPGMRKLERLRRDLDAMVAHARELDDDLARELIWAQIHFLRELIRDAAPSLERMEPKVIL